MPMATSVDDAVVLELSHVHELFSAPDVNPFSVREIAILGETGIERLRKRAVSRWPRKPRPSRVILQLPPDDISTETVADISAAIRRFCAAQIDRNRVRRRRAVRAGLRQLGLAGAIILFDIVLLNWLYGHPVGLLPGPSGDILVALAVFAGLVA